MYARFTNVFPLSIAHIFTEEMHKVAEIRYPRSSVATILYVNTQYRSHQSGSRPSR